MNTTELKVAGKTCGGCEESIARALRGLVGVTDVRADFESGTVAVTTTADVARAALESAIEDAGYEVIPSDGGLTVVG
jgi:copper chaperone CopZ